MWPVLLAPQSADPPSLLSCLPRPQLYAAFKGSLVVPPVEGDVVQQAQQMEVGGCRREGVERPAAGLCWRLLRGLQSGCLHHSCPCPPYPTLPQVVGLVEVRRVQAWAGQAPLDGADGGCSAAARRADARAVRPGHSPLRESR